MGIRYKTNTLQTEVDDGTEEQQVGQQAQEATAYYPVEGLIVGPIRR